MQPRLALANFHDTHRVLPAALLNPGRFESLPFYSQGNRLLNTSSWAMPLPFLDQANAFERYEFNQCSTQSSPLAMLVAGTDSTNSAVTEMFVSVLECTSHTAAGEVSTHLPGTTDIYWRRSARRTSYLFATGRATDWDLPWSQTAGEIRRGMFGNNGAAKMRDLTDGCSKTIAAGESHGGANQKVSVNFGPWGLTGTNTCCHGRVVSDSSTSVDPIHFTDARGALNAAWDATERSHA